jgi:predicted nuclease with RNAse H fold
LRFVGIDLSTNPRDCGVCVIEGRAISHVGHGNSTSSHPDWLLRHCSEASTVGIDAPFGWPKPFIDALRGYDIGVAFDRDRRRYRLRTTDLWINATLQQHLRRNTAPPSPFSVSTDKLGATTMVGTILLRGLSGKFEVSPRHSGSDRAVLEVYPSVSLWAWGLPHRGVDVGATLQTLKDAFDIDIREDERRQLLGSRHCFDALVAALTAREYTSDNTYDPPESVPEEVLRVEGWIRVPSRRSGERFRRALRPALR